MKAWKEKIKSVSVWAEEDLAVFEENPKLFNRSSVLANRAGREESGG